MCLPTALVLATPIYFYTMSAQLKAVLDNDPQMTRAVASAILALLKAQEAERQMYDIKPSSEPGIMRRGMNRQN